MPDFARHVRDRLGSLPLRPEREAEIVEEIAGHVKIAFEEARRRGIPENEALARAEQPFLPWDALREQILSAEHTLAAEVARIETGIDDYLIARRQQGGGWLIELAANLWQDLRFAQRSFRLLPAFSIPAILTLALAIGATTAVFSFVNGILLTPLDYQDPDQLVALQFMPANITAEEAFSVMDARNRRHTRYNVSYPNFEYWQQATTNVLEDIAAYDDTWRYTVGFGDGSELLPGTWVSAGLFPLLRVQPQIGRLFLEEEDAPGAGQVVILSHRLWQRKFAGSGDVVGQILHIRERPHTIVGVMPAGFGFPAPETEFWRPMGGATRAANSINYEIMGRLNPEITLKQADALLQGRTMSQIGRGDIEEQWAGGVLSLHEYIVGDVRRLMLVFLAAVAAVLLIACVNVANLMLTQAVGREKEHILRAALGAGSKRLAQQLLTESMLMSLVSGLIGLGLAVVLTRAMLVLTPSSLPRQNLIGMDSGVLVFTVTLSIVVGLIVGLMPAVRASRINLATGLNTHGRGSSGSIQHYRMRHGLVVIQLGMALILLVCAGLLLRSFSGMLTIERGFDPQDVLAFETDLPRSRYQIFEDHTRFYDELLEGMRAMPGVSSAAIAIYLPGTSWFHTTDFVPPAYERLPGEELVAEIKEVSPGYFTTLGIRLAEGRLFDDRDAAGSAPTMLINQEMARKYWPDGDVIGSTITMDPGEEYERKATVIGIVDDVRLRAGGRERGDEEKYQIYVPFSAWGRSLSMDVLARTEISSVELVPSIRRLVASIDPEVVLFGIGTVEDLLVTRTSEPRYRTLLISLFGLVALILAVVGVYGVMAYAVSQRTREIGIRLALGAHEGRIMKEVFTRGLNLTLVGLGLGLVGAWAAVTVLEGYLYEIDVHDPATFTISLLVLAASALLACTLPALRAARVDPIIALRTE